MFAEVGAGYETMTRVEWRFGCGTGEGNGSGTSVKWRFGCATGEGSGSVTRVEWRFGCGTGEGEWVWDGCLGQNTSAHGRWEWERRIDGKWGGRRDGGWWMVLYLSCTICVSTVCL